MALRGRAASPLVQALLKVGQALQHDCQSFLDRRPVEEAWREGRLEGGLEGASCGHAYPFVAAVQPGVSRPASAGALVEQGDAELLEGAAVVAAPEGASGRRSGGGAEEGDEGREEGEEGQSCHCGGGWPSELGSK